MPKRAKLRRRSKTVAQAAPDVHYYREPPMARAVEPQPPAPVGPWTTLFACLSETDEIIGRIRNAIETQISPLHWGPGETSGAVEKPSANLSIILDRVREHRRVLIALMETLENAA